MLIAYCIDTSPMDVKHTQQWIVVNIWNVHDKKMFGPKLPTVTSFSNILFFVSYDIYDMIFQLWKKKNNLLFFPSLIHPLTVTKIEDLQYS